MSLNLKELSEHTYNPGRLTLNKHDQICYRPDAANKRKQREHLEEAIAKICTYLKENPHLQNDPQEVASGRKLTERLRPSSEQMESWKTLRNWVLQGEWAQGKEQERPQDSADTSFVKPGEVIKPAESIHILGHAFPYRLRHMDQLVVAAPNFKIICGKQEFPVSKEFLVKVLNYVRSTAGFAPVEAMHVPDADPKAVALLCQSYLGGRPMPKVSAELTWEYVDLANYMQCFTVAAEMAGAYLRDSLDRDRSVIVADPVPSGRMLQIQNCVRTLDFSRFEKLNLFRMQQITGLTLTSLDVSHNIDLDAKSFELIGRMTTLVLLNVGYSSLLDDDGLKKLSGLVNLTWLDMSGARQIRDNNTMTALQNFPKMETLKLNESQSVATQSLTVLNALPLRNLELKISTTDFSQLTGLTQLTRLDYSQHINLTHARVREIVGQFPALRELVLKDCQFIEPIKVEELADEKPGLKISL